MDTTLSRQIGNLLRKRGLSLSTAESCTGGLIGHLLTNVPGSSDYYLGGVVAYANDAKMRLLYLPPGLLAQYGAVSRETVLEMARGIRQFLGADLGLSVSGVAGPGGGTVEKPVGTVWVGLASPEGAWARLYHFSGNRQQNKTFSAEAALNLLSDYLHGMRDLEADHR
jgi:PncC family amidohydrolase